MKYFSHKFKALLFISLIYSTCLSQNLDNNQADKLSQLYKSEILKTLQYSKVRFKENVMGIFNIKTQDSLTQKFRNVHQYVNSDVASVVVDSISGYTTKNGELKMFPQFEMTYWFSSDFGYAVKNKKGALINGSGKLLTDYIFEQIGGYNEGFVRVSRDKKMNYANKKGKLMFDDKVLLDYFFIMDNVTKYIDSIGPSDKKIAKQGLISVKNEIIVPAIYDKISGFFSEGLMYAENEGKSGFLDKKNQIIIPFEYEELKDEFSEGLVGAKQGDKWGFINKKNEIVIPFKYDAVERFKNGLALVTFNGKLEFINNSDVTIISNNKFILRNQSFAFGLCKIRIDGKYGFINNRGEVVIQAIYERASHFINGYAVVRKNGLSGVIDAKGNIVVPIKFKEVSLPVNEMVYFLN